VIRIDNCTLHNLNSTRLHLGHIFIFGFLVFFLKGLAGFLDMKMEYKDAYYGMKSIQGEE
jgi:hypothetical protein